MKNLPTLSVLAIVLALGVYQAEGQFVWKKDARNPILSEGASGAWNSHIAHPCVLFNTDSSRYEMWFIGYTGLPGNGDYHPYNIGFAFSKDGIDWTMSPSPVLTPTPSTWDAYTVDAPMVIRQNGQYKMWYTSFLSPTSPDYLGYATSADGIHWTKYSGNPVMGPGRAAWEVEGPYGCCVIPFHGGYKMWYAGLDATFLKDNIGYATSPDGITWLKDTINNPVLKEGTTGEWDDAFVANPQVLAIGSTYYMWYTGLRSQTGPRAAGVATSNDTGKTWTKYAGNPVLMPSEVGWDGTWLEPGSVLQRGDTLDMWYFADVSPFPSNRWSIGHATSLAKPFPNRKCVPQDYATIQAGIDAAVNGDTVLVSDNTYFENIRFKGKKIVVTSAYLTTGDTSHISRTIINGSKPTNPDSGSVVSLLDGEDTTSVLCGFTITGGTGTIENAPPPYGVGRTGGGIFSSSGGRICHNRIVYNSVSSSNWVEGGGLEFDYTVGPTGIGLVIIENNMIAFNAASSTNQSADAGGLVVGGTGRVFNNEITDNICSTQGTQGFANGGGLEGGLSTLVVENNFIARNKALAPNTVQNSSFGGGVYYWTTNMEFRNNTVVDNLVQSGANISAYGGGVAFQAATRQSNINISGNLIANNTVLGGSKSSGGGIGIWDEGARIENNIIVRNSAWTGGGVGVRRFQLTTGESPLLINNTIAFNRASSGTGGSVASGGAWAPKVINTIAWGDTGIPEIVLFDGSSIRVLYSDIQGGWPTDSGNIDVNPLFVDTTYRLSDSSNCIGAGTDSVQIGGVWYEPPTGDMHGMMRPNPLGSRPDIGACENYRSNPLTGVAGKELAIPNAFALSQNYPNPFNPSTKIQFTIANRQLTIVKVFDLLGREVATLVNEVKQPGTYTVQFDARLPSGQGSNLASGVYFYRLQAGSFIETRRLLLIR